MDEEYKKQVDKELKDTVMMVCAMHGYEFFKLPERDQKFIFSLAHVCTALGAKLMKETYDEE